MESFSPQNMKLTQYLFYTGKGGVGKTSTACPKQEAPCVLSLIKLLHAEGSWSILNV